MNYDPLGLVLFIGAMLLLCFFLSDALLCLIGNLRIALAGEAGAARMHRCITKGEMHGETQPSDEEFDDSNYPMG